MTSSRRLFGLVCAVSMAGFVVVWLTFAASPPRSLAQDSPAATPAEQEQSPVETPVEQGQSPSETPTFTPTSTATDTPVPVEAPTETPTDTPGPPPPEPSTDTPTPLSSPPEEAPPPGATVTPQGTGPGTQEPPTVEAEQALATETPTPRPVAFPTPTPTPSILVLMDRSLTGLLGAAAWIWFVCGSLVFFIVAGIVAGLGFYRQERNRYRLYELTPDEETPVRSQAQTGEDEDIWPPSLP